MTARRPLEFGISVTPYAEAYPQIVEQVLTAERTGFDLVGIQDDPGSLPSVTVHRFLLARRSRSSAAPIPATVRA